jgi:hypothetical protein
VTILEDATAVALKRVIAWQIAEEMKAQQITKTELAFWPANESCQSPPM